MTPAERKVLKLMEQREAAIQKLDSKISTAKLEVICVGCSHPPEAHVSREFNSVWCKICGLMMRKIDE